MIRLGLNWRRSLAEIAWTWAQIVGVIALVGWVGRWWVYPPVIIFIAARQYALAVLLHEGQHRLLYPRRRVNDWIGQWLLAAPLMSDFESSRQSHLAHHRYLGNKLLDPDWIIYAGGGLLRAKGHWSWGAVAVQVGFVVVLTQFVGRFAYPVLWFLPLIIAGLLDRIRIRAEHSPDGRVWSHRSNPVERFFLSPYHMNYHAEHHIAPHVPHYRLPEKRRELSAVTPPEERLRWTYAINNTGE